MSIIDDIRKRLSQARSSFDTSANNAINNGVVAFGNSGVGKALVNTQNFLEGNQQVSIPQIPQIPQQYANTPVMGGVLQGGRAIGNFASSIVNTPLQFTTGTGLDIANNIGRTLRGDAPINYNQARSGATRLGYNIGSQFNPESINNMGIKNNAQEILGNAGSIAAPILSVYGGGKVFGVGKNIVEKAAGKTLLSSILAGAKPGAAIGGLYSAADSLANNRDKTLPQQLEGAALSGATGAVMGGVLGGVTGAAGHGLQAGIKKIAETFKLNNPKLTDIEAKNQASTYVKDRSKRFVGGTIQDYPDTFYNSGLDKNTVAELDKKFKLPAGTNNGGFAEAQSGFQTPTSDQPTWRTGTTDNKPLDLNAVKKSPSGAIGKLENRLNELTGFQPNGDNWKQQYHERNSFIDHAMQSAPPEVQAEIQSINKKLNDIRGVGTPLLDLKPTIKPGETVGQFQQRIQNPDLSAYENAFNTGDKGVMNQLAQKYPNDARFNVHNDGQPIPGVPVQEPNSPITAPQTLPPEPGLVQPVTQIQPPIESNPLINQVKNTASDSIPQTTTPLNSILKPKVETPLPLQSRGLTTSVKDATNVIDPVKTDVNAAYAPKTNDVLMGEAKLLLQDGAKLDLNKVKNVDQKVAATIQEAINQQGTNPQLAANLFNNLSEQGTELGRGVQAFSLLKNMSPESIALSTAGKIKKYNLTAIKKIPEMTGDQVQLINDKIAAMDGLAQGSRERNIAYNDLQTTINNFIPSSLADKLITTWKAGLLTSLRTHERNLVGNAIMSASEIAKDPIATVADKLMGLRTGKRTVTTTLRGMFSGAKKGTKSAADILRYGSDMSADIEKFDQNHITWENTPVQQFLKRATGAVFNTLGAEDQVFWHSLYARSMYDQAGAEAINVGQKGNRAFIEQLVHNPTEQMATTALNDANYATFHDKSVLSHVANSIKRAATEGVDIQGKTIGGGKVSKEVGKVVTNVLMPFTGVPSSIVGKTIAYSPIGLVKGAVTAGRVLAGQVPELQRQASQEIGRGVIGTGLFGLGAYLMSKGLMTGQPKDIKESDLWTAQGKQANSVMIGGKWRSIGSIGPQNLIMLAGAKAMEEAKSPDGSIANYALGLGKDQLSQTFLAGVQGPLNALTDPARYGKQYVGGLASSLVPNIVKDTAKAFDTSQRENNTIQDYVTNSIPGLRNNNIPARTVLGDIKPQEPTGVGAFFDLFNSKTPIDNVVTNELGRLNDTGNSATPSKIKNTQTIGKDKIKLTFEQLNTLEKGVGEVLKPQLTTLISSPVYQSMDDEHKAKAIGDLVSNVRSNYKNINGPDIVAGNPVADTSKLATDQLSSTSNTKTTDKSTSLSYVDSNGAYKTITIKKPGTTPTNNYQKAIQEAETFKQLDKVISNNDLSTSDKSSLINALGINQGDADYYTISSETKSVRDGYVQDELQTVKTPQELYPKLIGWRRQINGKMVLSNPMVDDLAKQGVISKAEAKALKNVSYTGDMNSKQTSGNIANQLNSSSGSTGGSGATAKMQKAYKDLINSITKSAAKPKSSAEAINNVLKYTKGSKSNTANNAGSLKSVLASKGKTLDSIFNYKVKKA